MSRLFAKNFQAALISSLFCIFTLFCHTASAKDIVFSTPQKLPAFVLNDHDGKPFNPERLLNQWSMIFVGFTTCPDVCPMTLSNLEAVRADLSFRLKPEDIPQIVFLAVDPDRDTPVLKEYLHYFHPDYVGITGDKKEIDRLVKSIGGFYRIKKKYEGEKNYLVQHTATVFLINPQGELAGSIEPPFKAHSTGEYLTQLIRKKDNS